MSNISKFEKCPNCSEPRHLDVKDCPYCGVIYDKVLPKDMVSGPQVNIDLELLQFWQDLVTDYNNKEKHELFLQKALAKKRLPFASGQYRKLLEVNPEDEVAKEMQKRILNLATVVMLQTKRDLPPTKGGGVAGILMILGVLVICMGFVFGQNLSLPGLTIIILGIGFKYFIKARQVG